MRIRKSMAALGSAPLYIPAQPPGIPAKPYTAQEGRGCVPGREPFRLSPTINAVYQRTLTNVSLLSWVRPGIKLCMLPNVDEWYAV